MSNSRIVKYGGAFVGIAFVAAVAAYFFLPADNQNAAPNQPTVTALAPEMIVRPVHGQFLAACQSPQLLNELIGHIQAHEKTKYMAMFNNFSCAQIPEDQKFKVLSVSNDMVEFVNSTSGASDGMWTVVEAFAPAK